MDLPSASAFNADPILAAAIAVAVGTAAWLLTRAQSHSRRGLRVLALATAATLLGSVWLSPLATVAGHYLLSAHLLQITILMGVVAPLLLLALPRHPRVSAPRPLAAVLRVMVHPVVAIVAVNAAFFGWHLSGPYDASLTNASVYALQQVTLLVTSMAFWWPIISPFSPPLRAMSPLGKLGYILLATIPQTFGGLAVALAHHVLYSGYGAAPRLLGLDLMTDQQISGASIALVSKIALFAAFTVIFMRLLQTSSPETDEGGGGGGGGSPRIDAPRPVPSGSPRWLKELEAGHTVPEPQPAPRVRELAGSGSRRV